MRLLGRLLSVVALLATLLVLAFEAGGTAMGRAAAPSRTSARIGALSIPVPRGLGRYDIRTGGHMVGTRAPVSGVLATDDPGAHYGGGGFAKWSQVSSGGPPADKVALVVQRWLVIGPDPPLSALRIHLPLNLHQPWFREHLKNGRLGYRWGYLRFHRQFYSVIYWSGRAAPANDRAAVLNALTSIRLTR
jgi:hypothetical protein